MPEGLGTSQSDYSSCYTNWSPCSTVRANSRLLLFIFSAVCQGVLMIKRMALGISDTLIKSESSPEVITRVILPTVTFSTGSGILWASRTAFLWVKFSSHQQAAEKLDSHGICVVSLMQRNECHCHCLCQQL